MINEVQLNSILNNEVKSSKVGNLRKYAVKNNKTLFGSPLKRFINNIYDKFEIPKESFIISLYYLYNFYNNNKDKNELIEPIFNNINIYIFTCIIISLKQLFDEYINVRNICEYMNINYELFRDTEIIILKGINWNTSFSSYNYENFKMWLEHYKDLHLDMDCLN